MNNTGERSGAARALDACIAAALASEGRPLSIYDYARETGISARMLIHYFGSKAAIDTAVIANVQDGLRAEVTRAIEKAKDRRLDRVFQTLAARNRQGVVPLLRFLLARSLSGDRSAVAAMRAQRSVWKQAFRDMLSAEEARQAMILLEGSLIGLILDELKP